MFYAFKNRKLFCLTYFLFFLSGRIENCFSKQLPNKVLYIFYTRASTFYMEVFFLLEKEKEKRKENGSVCKQHLIYFCVLASSTVIEHLGACFQLCFKLKTLILTNRAWVL